MRMTSAEIVQLRVGEAFGTRVFPRVRKRETGRGQVRSSCHRSERRAAQAARQLRDRLGVAATYWPSGARWWVGYNANAPRLPVVRGDRDGGYCPF